MSKKMKVLVSGLGRIAWPYHLPMLEKDERFELIAVADPSAERCSEAVQQYPQINTYSDYDAMLEAEKSADMVVIASPTMFHLPQTVAALERKLAVFLEKPMCESWDSACKLADAVKKYQGKVMLYQPHRANQQTLLLKNEIIPKLGKINHAKRVLSLFNRRNDWQSRKDCGGGMLNNYGAHYIDQFMCVFGSGKLKIEGCMMRRTVGIGDAEDLVDVLMVNEHDISCNLEINLGSADFIDSWDVYGSLGSAHWDNKLDHWQIAYVEPGTLPELDMQQTLAAQNRSYSLEGSIPWIRETVALDSIEPVDFYDCIYKYFVEDKMAFVPFEESMRLMKALHDCRIAAEGK